MLSNISATVARRVCRHIAVILRSAFVSPAKNSAGALKDTKQTPSYLEMCLLQQPTFTLAPRSSTNWSSSRSLNKHIYKSYKTKTMCVVQLLTLRNSCSARLPSYCRHFAVSFCQPREKLRWRTVSRQIVSTRADKLRDMLNKDTKQTPSYLEMCLLQQPTFTLAPRSSTNWSSSRSLNKHIYKSYKTKTMCVVQLLTLGQYKVVAVIEHDGKRLTIGSSFLEKIKCMVQQTNILVFKKMLAYIPAIM
ncbi:hypothetical protein TSAR_012823 [Trichomalopsis sarcophagae]|uniref:Uncharacterized protein n=1 Tax=Trichomalopsis sarcophagae TaxID=543379 RepID=A0A232F448_9HYME|nr:hypothetical protein TSAR_012823 [Trichomalopsis sarcophagae]